MIIPAIDLLEQRIVRLFQGDYSQTRYYDVSLPGLAQAYANAGAEIIHIIDLEGARNAQKRQLELIKKTVRLTDVKFQIGGGIRSENDVEELLKIGVDRVIIGSLAIKEPEKVSTWIKQFGQEKIVLALDVSIDEHGKRWLPTKGWLESSGCSLEDTLGYYENAKHILCTDISRDGTLKGSNTSLYMDIVAAYPDFEWQASGGIGELNDISEVAETGVSGIIVGRALLDEKFTLEEALQCWPVE